MSLGWEGEQKYGGRPVVSNAIAKVLDEQDHKVLFFAAASNDGSRCHDFFPAKHEHVFPIRATDTYGSHAGFNAALPTSRELVYGTLGKQVPTSERGNTETQVPRDGTSPATAIAAGLAALVIGYINVYGRDGAWDEIRTHHGFKQFLGSISNLSDEGKCFFTLEEFYRESSWKVLDARLNIASRT
jgi:subtilisin family serine protease